MSILLANFDFDIAEKEPSKVCPLSVNKSPRSHLESLEREAMASRAEHAAMAEKVMANDKLIQEMKQQVDMLRSIDWVDVKKNTENK